MAKPETNTKLTPIHPPQSDSHSGAVTREQAEAAVRILIEWIGENPDREGLLGTPGRVARAYQELFSGYGENPKEILRRTFEEVDGYDEMVVLRDIRFESHCEHHILPIIGRVHVAYLPSRRVIGISKLARIVDIYARRLQIQEKLTWLHIHFLMQFRTTLHYLHFLLQNLHLKVKPKIHLRTLKKMVNL